MKLLRAAFIIIFFQIISAYSLFAIVHQKFLYYTDIDGLPRNIVTSVEQDKYGYIWIGTGNGIARYDGNTFTTYEQLKGINIICLFIDSRNNLWVGSSRGILLYNRITNIFEPKTQGYIRRIQEDNGEIYYIDESGVKKLKGNDVQVIRTESDILYFNFVKNGLWYVGNGVKLLSREGSFREVVENNLGNFYVSAVTLIGDKLLFGCKNGQLFLRNPDGSYVNIPISNHHNIKKIVRIDQEIWVATDGNGLIILDQNMKITNVLRRNQNAPSINSNSIYDVFYGINREIWIASYGAGLTCILPDNLLFRNIVPEKGNRNSLISSEGVAIYEKDGIFYFGTNYGFSIWNEKTDVFTNFSLDKLKKELKGVKALGISSDNKKNIWLGTYDGLLGKYSSGHQLSEVFYPSTGNPEESQQIVVMYNHNNTNLVLGTQFQNHSLINFDLKTKSSSVLGLIDNSGKITQFQINAIRENQKGEVMVLNSTGGIFRINFSENKLEDSYSELNKKVNFWINDFYNDKNGNYWLTTNTEGLVKISANGNQMKKWTDKDGLPSNSLIRIESVDDRFLWISSIAGICRFEMETGQVMNFNHRNGLPANEFTVRCSAKTSDGRIIFGSYAGFTIINPANVVPDSSKIQVIISDITFQNQSIKSAKGKSHLAVPLEEAKVIRLPYNRNSFTIYFFTKNKDFPKYNNYNYRMVGLDKEWTYLSETNHINFTNLSPGTYTFEVKSSSKTNIDGNFITQLTISINPPWYLSWYAFMGYLVLVSGLIYISLSIYTNRIQLKKEVEISEYKVQKEHELTEKKLAFFTNISHDLRTPLTLIDGPVNDLLQSKNLERDQTDKLIIIRRNSRRLYKLITDLLDFRKITEKQFALEVSETDITELIDGVYHAFQEECRNNSIIFNKEVRVEQAVFIDVRKVEKILWNLLSNAVKFTPPKGKIFIGANELLLNDKRFIELIVKDSGLGISASDQTKIFEPFFQGKTNRANSMEGTGIGLSIVKDLVELHHGEILFDSALGIGTTFKIVIPDESVQYKPAELGNPETANIPIIDDKPETKDINAGKKGTPSFYNRPKILIVEDNKELREYLATHFEKKYKVSQAEDGMMGFETAKDINPDVILTDVQMPNMNGYDFCKAIRGQFDTSHIPLIMLTANSDVDQHIEGLATGADAYVTKPFDINLIDSVLNSVLENRRKLRLKFMGIDANQENEKLITSRDHDFIVGLKNYVEKNMALPELNIELISAHFAVSRTQLNHKIKSLMGTTPNNLIKSLRLKRAYHLIRNEGVRVSEAAYLTGFSDPNYFTTCFKKEFGENPSQIGTDTTSIS